MAYRYRIKKKIDKSSTPTKVRYYAVPVRKGIVNLETIAEEISYSSSMTPADVLAVVKAVADLMEKKLCEGNQVKIDPIGIFYLSATSPGFDSPDQCKKNHVKMSRVCFSSSRKFRNNIKTKVEFRKEI